MKSKTWDETYFTQLEDLNNKIYLEKIRNFFTLKLILYTTRIIYD